LAKEVIMPKFGFTQEESEILEWMKHEGEKVEKGDPIALVSTDKLSMEIEATESGILSGVKFKVGDKVPVTTTIAYILQPGEALPMESSNESTGNKKPSSPIAEKSIEPDAHITPVAERMLKEKGIEPAQIKGSGPYRSITQKDVEDYLKTSSSLRGKVNAVPVARRLSKQLKVDITQVKGSGPQGRIQSEDVRKASSQPHAVPVSMVSPEPGAKVIPLVGMRRTIAMTMQRSMQEAPHITLQVDVDMHEAEAFHKLANEMNSNTGVKISLTAIIAKATSWALTRHPYLNSRLEDENILLLTSINMGIAVALEDGLIVPVIQNAQHKSIVDIALEIKELSSRARENRMRQQDLIGGTFTISNLGMYGIDCFTAIINPPQTGILAVGRMQNRFLPDENNLPSLRPIMTLTLSADHRVVDGVIAAKFMNDVRVCLEHPEILLL
jgi:pyruvate dehydrogenase E2 component (dihydrolipoamide acetyltransferase)